MGKARLRFGELFASPDFDYAPLLKVDRSISPFHVTSLGALFAEDCRAVLPCIRDEVIDTVFADPPFNIGKEYGRGTDDARDESAYIDRCKEWLLQCVRTLKPGGSIFSYNLPKWNILLGAYLSELGLEFRHWIAIEMSSCLPIPGRLHPSHYSLLYYSKGKPSKFHRVRTPILLCRHCGKEIKDYGGHRNALNPRGVTLKDVWTDIPTVRHWKYKSKSRRANSLSTKIIDRVLDISTDVGDVVLDLFGGSGTTFAVCENKSRKWLGVEIDYAPAIVERLETGIVHNHKNDDFVDSD